MLSTHLDASADLPTWAIALAFGLALVALVMLLVELRRRERGGVAIAASGVLSLALLVGAVLRPTLIRSRDTTVGARVVVLADASRSMALRGDDGRPRSETRDDVIARLRASARGARLEVLGFGEGTPTPLGQPRRSPDPASGATTRREPPIDPADSSRARRSDLGAALAALASSPAERPAAIVVVSDGRLDDPPEDASSAALAAVYGSLRVPIDTIPTARDAPADASVRRVSAAGAAIAHVPLPLRVEVGCAGGIACDELTVTARELRDDGPPVVLASGVAHVRDGKASLDLTVTLERAGTRVVEVAIEPPSGDVIPANDRRLVTFDVARERVRVLHVAGRPTNDVRALRQWLKGDASVDIVAFFILRTPFDDVHATQNELALIPFPVDELFTEHLPSFDAVVLQDFDAQPYGLEKYLGNIRGYVRGGGGLVMVGGQNSFVAGGYAGTPLADVLPIDLDGSANASADTSPFVPDWTAEGRVAPLLGPLRNVVGEDLPEMPGTNILGDVRPGGIALWSHPTRTTRSGAKMPVLAVAEEGEGRSIALGVDGAWELQFSALGARTGGRGHGALWDGLLGWLMHDPRFEAAQLEIVGGCTAGLPSKLRARVTSAASNPQRLREIALDVAAIDHPRPSVHISSCVDAAGAVECSLPPFEAGAYAARMRTAGGALVRYDFACEAGGDEWADSRPDPQRLVAIAHASGGVFALPAEAGSISLPAPTVVSAERRVTPITPPWAWSFGAALTLGIHWLTRRRGGLS
jgi:uncharacterized membrane protein